jgi:ferredoxin
MGIVRVWIEDGCVTCGNSEEVCPEVFEIDIEAETSIVLNCDDFSAYEDQIRLAAESCPVQVIKFEEN